MNYSKVRKPTPAELEELRDFEFDVHFDMGVNQVELRDELDEAITQALIGVFPDKENDSDKMMFVIWGSRSMYNLYTWVNGELKSVVQDVKGIQYNHDPEYEWTVT